MAKITEVKAPGKLMVAGEYAVLEPYQPLIVTAVNRFIHVTIEEAENNQLSLLDYELNALNWQFENKKITINHQDKRLNFVKKAMSLALEYLNLKNIPIQACHIKVKSDLIDASGIKLGLGSSAAVVVAVIKGIVTHFTGRPIDKADLFKLAAITHVAIQKSGSGADIAASVYGGILKYTSFQADWLLEKIAEQTLADLIEENWRYLSIEEISFPENLAMYVGWTGQAASTKDLVAQIRAAKQSNSEFYQSFLKESKTAVLQIAQGLEKNNLDEVFTGIEKNRQTLSEIGKKFKVPVETAKLYKLSQIGQALLGAGKLSGAGGGDCGIVFLASKDKRKALFKAWQENGIEPLDLQPFFFEM